MCDDCTWHHKTFLTFKGFMVLLRFLPLGARKQSLIDCLMIAYIVLFALARGSTRATSFLQHRFLFLFLFFNIHRSGVLTALAWLVPQETAAVSAQVLSTLYNHAPCHFMQSHIHKVHASLAVTCHVHFWQNDQDLLRATGVKLHSHNTFLIYKQVHKYSYYCSTFIHQIRTRAILLTLGNKVVLLTDRPSVHSIMADDLLGLHCACQARAPPDR